MIQDFDVKIGQMIMVGFRGTEAGKDSQIIKFIKEFHLGGVWLVDNENPMGETLGNISSPEQLKKLTGELQSASDIPLLISIDAEGGKVIRLKEKYGFPKTYSAKEIGEKDDSQFTKEQYTLISGRLKESGVNMNLAPVIDLFINPDNPALGGKDRCLSADPAKVAVHARMIIEALHSNNVFCCLKHFPGHGSSTEDTHIGCVDVSKTWTSNELIPYQQLIKDGIVDAVLTAHIFNEHLDKDYPATLSHKIITGLLREKLGFNGVVISDDILMGAIKDNFSYDEAIELALNAGVDIILQSNVLWYREDSVEEIFDIIKKGVLSGRISEEKIEESYIRIMNLKKRLIC